MHPSLRDPRPKQMQQYLPNKPDGSVNRDFAQWPSVEECKGMVGDCTSMKRLRQMVKTGCLLAVGVESGWIPHVTLMFAYLLPMLFVVKDEGCDSKDDCKSYHLIMLSRFVPLPKIIMDTFRREENTLIVIKVILLIFCLKDSFPQLWRREKKRLRFDFLIGSKDYPFLWAQFIVAWFLLPCVLPEQNFVERVRRVMDRWLPAQSESVWKNPYESNPVNLVVVFCAAFLVAQFLIRFTEILEFQVHSAVSRKLLKCLFLNSCVALIAVTIAPWIADSWNFVLRRIYLSFDMLDGIKDGCNSHTERKFYMFNLHPDCVLEIVFAVNFSFVCALVVMFFIGVFMVIVNSSLELHGELLFASLRLPYFKHFLRLRVHSDGQGIDGYCIGVADPRAVEKVEADQLWGDTPLSRPVLVDSWRWKSRRSN